MGNILIEAVRPCGLCGEGIDGVHVRCGLKEQASKDTISLILGAKDKEMSKQLRDGTYIWVTWLEDLLVGDQSCVWATWFKAHWQYYEKVLSDFTKYRMEHTRLLHETYKEQRAAGENLTMERQNKFSYRTPSGALIEGVPDLVGFLPSASQGTVYDCKTGQQREVHQVQVMIYMYLLPLAHPMFAGKTFNGVVVYNDGTRIPVPATAIDDIFITNFNYWVDQVSAAAPALKVPSESECRYCDIAKAECPERMA